MEVGSDLDASFGNASSRHTNTTGSQVGSRFSSRISAFRNCLKISAESCFWNLIFFLGVVSESDFFRFSSAAKQTCDTLGFPQIVLIPRGVENLRQRWYVDGIACIRFNHGVPMITLYDTGRSTTRNSAIFSMVPALTARLIDPRAIVVSLRVLLAG